MMLLEFDSAAFGDDVAALVRGKRGVAAEAIKVTGVSHASFYRMLEGPPVKNISAILSVAAYFGLPLRKYMRSPYLG